MWADIGQCICWYVAPCTILFKNKVVTQPAHLRDEHFQHQRAIVHPIHPDFRVNKKYACLTVHRYNNRNHSAFMRSFVLYVQSLIQNLFLFPAFCKDAVALSVE